MCSHGWYLSQLRPVTPWKTKPKTKHVNSSLSNHRVTYSDNESWPDAPIQGRERLRHLTLSSSHSSDTSSFSVWGGGRGLQPSSLSPPWMHPCLYPKIFHSRLEVAENVSRTIRRRHGSARYSYEMLLNSITSNWIPPAPGAN